MSESYVKKNEITGKKRNNMSYAKNGLKGTGPFFDPLAQQAKTYLKYT